MLSSHRNTRVSLPEVGIFTLLALVLSLTLYSSPLARLLPAHDQSMFVYFGRAIDAGKIPYIDMFDHKGPILWLINAVGWLHLGPVHLLWLIELAVIAVSGIYIYKSALFFADRMISWVVSIVGLLMLMRYAIGGNISEEYALPCIAIALYYLLRYFFTEDSHPWHFVIFGLTGTLVFFIRANMVALWAVGVVTVLILEINQRRWQRLLQAALFTLVGALLVIVPIVIYCVMTNSLAAMIYGAFTFNMIYIANESKISLIKMLIFVGGTLFLYGVVIPQIYLIVKAIRKREQRVVLWFLVAVGLLNLATIILSRRTYSHYLITQIPVATMALAILLTDVNDWLAIKRHWHQSVGLALVVWIVAGVFGPVLGIGEFAHKISKMAKTTSESDQERLIAVYVREHTTTTDTIYEWRYDANIYNLSGRFANNKYFTLPSVALKNYPEIEKQMITSFKKSKPAYFIIKTSLLKKPATSNAEKRIRHMVKKNYQPVSIEGTNRLFRVYGLK